MTSFVPVNAFETTLLRAKQGQAAMSELLAALVAAELAVPTAGEVEKDGSGFQPLLFHKQDAPMLACFSDKSRIENFGHAAPYCLVMRGSEILGRIPPGYGLVVNPGQSIGFDVTPEGLAGIVRDFVH